MDIEVGDPGGPPSPCSTHKWKNLLLIDHRAKKSKRRRRREDMDEKKCLGDGTMTRV